MDVASIAHTTIAYIVNAARLSIDDLAQQHLLLADELLGAQNQGSASAVRAMMDVVDAIGALRFPNHWVKARDDVGYRQDVA